MPQVSVTVRVTDALNLTYDETFVINIANVNEPPQISGVADQTVSSGSSTGALSFMVTDGDTASAALVASAQSVALAPASGITLGGSGDARTVTVTPVAGMTGNATITLTVSDGEHVANSAFNVAVTSTSLLPVIAFDGKESYTGSDGNPYECYRIPVTNRKSILPNCLLRRMSMGHVVLISHHQERGWIYSVLRMIAGCTVFVRWVTRKPC